MQFDYVDGLTGPGSRGGQYWIVENPGSGALILLAVVLEACLFPFSPSFLTLTIIALTSYCSPASLSEMAEDANSQL